MGPEATDYLERLLKPGEKVDLEYDIEREDRYGRTLAGVFKDDLFVNSAIAAAGLGVAVKYEPNVKFYDEVLAAEQKAVDAGEGLFDPSVECTIPAQLDEADTAAIVLARGGYGITRLLEELEWSTFTRAPKWIVGFSDGTALLTTACAHSVCSLHASNVNGLASAASVDRAAWLDALEGRALVSWDLHATVGQPARSIRGTTFGGNLSLLAALAAHGRLTPPADAVWIVEDVTERPYRLDRMATSLRPFVRNARAVVLGEYVGCEPGPDGISAHQALCAAWGDLGVPLVWGAPSGHGARNAPWPLGAAVCVKLDAGRARIEFRRP